MGMMKRAEFMWLIHGMAHERRVLDVQSTYECMPKFIALAQCMMSRSCMRNCRAAVEKFLG